MLDDLKYIHAKDSFDALGSAARMIEPLTRKLDVSGSKVFKNVNNIVFVAMGDSALSAMIASVWSKTLKPMEIVRDYYLPSYLGKDSLVIFASNSGNTEETINAVMKAKKVEAIIAVITSGGKLLDMAKSNGFNLIELPTDINARYSGLYTFKALVQLLKLAGLAKESNVDRQLKSVYDFCEHQALSWREDVATKSNPAKKVALELIGKSVVIYSGLELYPATYKWKLAINQNAKHLAWVNVFPEYNHNEMSGWTRQPVAKPYAVIELRSSFENDRIKKRFDIDNRLLSGQRPEAIQLNAKGDTLLQQIIYMMQFGEFVSIYLALLNGIDPTTLKLVDKFKNSMGEFKPSSK